MPASTSAPILGIAFGIIFLNVSRTLAATMRAEPDSSPASIHLPKAKAGRSVVDDTNDLKPCALSGNSPKASVRNARFLAVVQYCPSANHAPKPLSTRINSLFEMIFRTATPPCKLK